MRFYRYIIYWLYSKGLKNKADTPATNVVLIISFVHFMQLFSVYLVFLKIFPQINIFSKVATIYIGLGTIIFAVVHHIFLYKKKRWENYIEEFKNESLSARKKGNILVNSYLIGSVGLFFLLLLLLYG